MTTSMSYRRYLRMAMPMAMGRLNGATVQATFPSRDERLRLAMSMTSGAITPT